MLLRVTAALAGALLVSGCLQPIEPVCHDGGVHSHPDAGVDPGGDAGDGSDAGADGGGEDVHYRADAGIFSWGTMGNWSDEEIQAIHGVPGGDPWVVTFKGRLLRWTGSGWETAWSDTATSPRILRGLYVSPSGKVYAGGSGVLLHCTGADCTEQSHFTATPTQPGLGGGIVYGLCGRGEDLIYAVGESAADGKVFRFDVADNAWKVLVADTGTAYVHGCFVAEDGTVFAATNSGRIIRIETNGIAFIELANSTAELIAANVNFRAVHGAGTHLFATGSGRKIAQRDASTKTWSFVHAPVGANELHHAMGGGAVDEVFAGGDSLSNGKLTRFDGETWAQLPDLEGGLTFHLNVLGIWAAGPDDLYLAGHRTYDGVVVRGVR